MELTPDELLTTTRSVRRRLDLDRPVPLALVEECVEIALQAPSGSNHQGWHFIVVSEPDQRAALGAIYEDALRSAESLPYAAVPSEDPTFSTTQARVLDSATYLARHIARCPVLVIPCIEARVEGTSAFVTATMFGSILPATWSFCLAARARGLGTAWTTLHLVHEERAAEVLGIPYERVTQVAMLPVAFTRGTRFRPAPRLPLARALHHDRW